MERDPDFERVMWQLGVRPMDSDAAPPPPQPRVRPLEDRVDTTTESVEPEVWEDPDAALFRQAMSSLHVAPNKDLSAESGTVANRRKVPKKGVFEPDQTLDLHGMTVDAALASLSAFVARSYARGVRSILVITGKGKHSVGGRGVLKPAVEQWVLNKGKRMIRSYAEAPRAHGGKGAFLLYLKAD